MSGLRTEPGYSLREISGRSNGTSGRHARVGAVVAFAALLAVMLMLSLQERHGPTRVLADGTTVELLGTTYGTNHELRIGNWLQQWLDRESGPPPPPPLSSAAYSPELTIDRTRLAFPYAPERSETRLHCMSSGPVLVLWFRLVSPRANFFPAVVPSLLDVHGCAFPANPSGNAALERIHLPSGNLGGPTLGYAITQVFSRRDPVLRVAFADGNGVSAGPPIEFRNPLAAKSVPAWSASSQPAVCRDGQATLELEGPVRSPQSNPYEQLRATLRRRISGRTCAPMTLLWSETRDATGNRLKSREASLHGGVFPVSGLCTHEPAWEVRIGYLPGTPPSPDEAMPPDVTWDIPDLAITGSGARTLYTSLAGSKLSMSITPVAVNGPGSGLRPTTTLRVHTRCDRWRGIGVLRATDALGRNLLVAGEEKVRALAPGPSDFSISLHPSSTARRIHFVLGVYRARTAKFVVCPPRSP